MKAGRNGTALPSAMYEQVNIRYTGHIRKNKLMNYYLYNKFGQACTW